MKTASLSTPSWPPLLFAAFLMVVLAMPPGCIEEAEPLSDELAEASMAPDSLTSDFVITGKDLYEIYCASCHGPAATGQGPVAALLTIPPPDLTRIQQRYEGTFPVDTLYRMIDGREEVPAHGTREMPIWGNAWKTTDSTPQSEEEIEHRINLLIEYLRSIQTTSD